MSLGIMDGAIEGLPEILRTITALYRIEEFKGPLNWAPIMPRDAVVSLTTDKIFLSLVSSA